MTRGIKRKLDKVQDAILEAGRREHETLGLYGRAMQYEGYVGGYLQALADVRAALEGSTTNGRFANLWRDEK